MSTGHTLTGTLAARDPGEDVKDPGWKRFGQGSAWAYDGDTFTFVPSPRAAHEAFSIGIGAGSGRMHEVAHAVGSLSTRAGFIRLDRYVLLDSEGRQVGGLLHRGNSALGETRAWFPAMAVREFLRSHPYSPALRSVTVSSEAELLSRFPLLADEALSRPRGLRGLLRRT